MPVVTLHSNDKLAIDACNSLQKIDGNEYMTNEDCEPENKKIGEA